MGVSRTARGLGLPSEFGRSLIASAMLGLLALASMIAAARAEEATDRLFIQVWWDSPSIEMDPSDDPGRIEVYVGEVFIGCAVAPSHINHRKQLMLVPPSLGFTGKGTPDAVRITVTGYLGTLPARRIKITQI